MLDPDFSKTSTKDLEDLRYNSQFGSRLFLGADYELQKRLLLQTSKPHWSVTPNFWITVIACLAAIVAAIGTVLVEFRAHQSAHKEQPSAPMTDTHKLKP
jgi:hypothetical protein